MSSQGKHPNHYFFVALLLASCLTSSVTQAASVDGIPAGDWRGILPRSEATGPVYVRLSERATGASGPQVGDLRFGPPFNCALELRAQNDAYTLTSRNGGKFCEAQTGRQAQLRVMDEAAESIELTLLGHEQPLVITLDQKREGLAEAGRWRGAGLISAQLEIVAANVRPGDVLGRLRYGAPRDCQVELRYAGRVDGALTTWVVANDRGYCRQLSDSQATMQIRPDGSATLSIFVKGQRDTLFFEHMP
ncbi:MULTISPECIES: hypothetical protein [Xanthomonas]|uniref:hypothetical protein n=1 Tax=Xanthomonas TaxID=338 RepID=UPI0003B004DF|nr:MULTISPECIES: hypothetical protein [Xanthomonas]ATS62666.1 hypothetical protein XcfCFBP4885P_03870 [Xanthomonas citri pv. phaseoli var. fuscans]ATS72294.1 hypothetical protein XcfCFBP6166P_12445 [Xanthomonas citri pv. phaseoli var. fuscans]ATS75063.1 hypothetical protein XcfCFBP6975P_04150 [Xanthomonas citri pv. phaseoli var. fuscans]ATS81247.1 hypothetical protein XcfCFBP7767P_17370 [Xanthomonas citri pv. phaseoli var. fuscans]KGP22262.2 hypothetical protein NY68_20120 [Xanthomonas citri p